MRTFFRAAEFTKSYLGAYKGANTNQSVNPETIYHNIQPAELSELKPILGTALYDDFINTRVSSDYVPFSDNPLYPPVDMFPPTAVAYNK